MKREFLLRTIRPARPLRRNVRCIAFMASAALIGVMVAQGIRVRLNVLDGWHYVAPLEDITSAQLHELLHNDQFKYIAVVTFLTSNPGSLQSWPVPGNWNSSNNNVQLVSAGGSGGWASTDSTAGGATGGGGGGYAKTVNVVLTPGGTASYSVAAGGSSGSGSGISVGNGNSGGAGWFNGTTVGGASVGANGGTGGAQVVSPGR
jgi:hypothetical protein